MMVSLFQQIIFVLKTQIRYISIDDLQWVWFTYKRTRLHFAHTIFIITIVSEHMNYATTCGIIYCASCKSLHIDFNRLYSRIHFITQIEKAYQPYHNRRLLIVGGANREKVLQTFLVSIYSYHSETGVNCITSRLKIALVFFVI